MRDFSSPARDQTYAPLHWEHGILTTEDSREVPGLTFMMETNLIFKILPVSMIKICGYLEQVKNNNLGRCLIWKTSNNSGIISEYVSFEKNSRKRPNIVRGIVADYLKSFLFL